MGSHLVAVLATILLMLLMPVKHPRYPRLQYVLKRPETLGKPWAPAIVHRWGPTTVQQRQWQNSFSRRQCPGHHQACQPAESEVVIFWANTMYFCLSVADIHPHFKPEKWLISWLSKLRSSMIFNCYLQIDTNRSFPGKKNCSLKFSK